MRGLSRRSLPVRAAVLALLAAAPTAAQENGQFSITPARRNLSGRPPAPLGATTVSNTTSGPIKVKVFPALLRQGIDGAFDVVETPRELREAGLILSAAPADFTLQPDSAQRVSLRWNLVPQQTRAVFLGIVFQGIQVNQQNQPVNQINRLVSLTFLRLPGKYRRSGEITGLRGEQSGPRKLTFYTRVKNTGQLVDQPRQTKFAIRDATGDVVFKGTWPSDIILPGAEREFPIPVDKVLPKGNYTAVTKMVFGTSRSRVEKRFTLVGPNELPTTKIVVTSLAASATLGKDVVTVSDVRNQGTQIGDVELSLTLQKLNGASLIEKPLGAKRVPVQGVKPSERRPVTVTFPPVPDGRYRVTLRYRDSAGDLQTLTADFQPNKAETFWHRFRRWFSDNIAWLLPAILLLLLLALLLFLRRWRRRIEERARQNVVPAEPAPPAPVAAAPAGPAVPGVVNINTATEAQLRTLPGIGPKAAQRIVEHREEYGEFASLDALSEVEGISTKRVDALRDRATT